MLYPEFNPDSIVLKYNNKTGFDTNKDKYKMDTKKKLIYRFL